MPHPSPSFAAVRASERLAGTPVVRRGTDWWLDTPTGSVLASDPAFTRELDRFAADMAAANQTVSELCAQPKTHRKARR
ncbi:hypothetical protein [Streptomyces sp. H27-D2]|uniref:hypothetical protein n=1 Tax=Streptomyces sp. H27-D2 TaxID=3046304 RepID=UPI002DBD46D2|nr:hypothetical protein [Streptomyces sp. H27-D2]MEC4018277.1 hypothetical protein [Streptomyces sp. H27-D2]